MRRGSHQLLIGNNLDTLRQIKPGTVQTCITSPPYFNLRSYLPKDHPSKSLEIGSERHVEEYIGKLVEVFGLVHECLHETGTLWVNIGDSYASGKGTCFNPGGGNESFKNQAKELFGVPLDRLNKSDLDRMGLKQGDQMLVPHRFALAMQADGWYLRDTIIWKKKSPMPSSVSGWRWMRCRVKVAEGVYKGRRDPRRTDCDFASNLHHAQKTKLEPCPGCDKCRANGGLVLRKGSWRCTTAYEHIFMFAKGADYFCDGDAVAEPATCKAPGNRKHKGRDAFANGDVTQRTKLGLADTGARETRNPRNVWSLSNEGTKLKHFAAFPTELVKRCLLAATSAGGCCPACRTPYAPIVESSRTPTRPALNSKVLPRVSQHTDSPYHQKNGSVVGNRDPQRHCTSTRILGYLPSCVCNAGDPIPQIVLDPFAGTGTTLQTAVWYGRDAIGCELSEDYAAMAEQRIAEMPRCMIREMARQRKPIPNLKADDGLFAGMAG